jgi:putative SOS response-associated peptidase YedK
MCSNYVPVTDADRLLQYFGASREASEPPHDVFPMQLAPFIRKARPGETAGGTHVVTDAIFRFVPDFVAKVDWARKTYNARSETVHQKPAYRDAWRAGQRCIIPAEAIYEPNYESGSAVRWRIAKASGLPMGIAGIYTSWTSPEGQEVFAMSMLTVNADDHPFMSRFHAPGHEKRMVVILEPADFEGWLSCPVADARAGYCKQWHGELEGAPVPLQRMPAKKTAAARPPTSATPQLRPPDVNGELF